MDNLNDDCLLYIFDFINPTGWVAASEVCTRWKQLLQRKWKMLTDINMVYDYDAFNVASRICKEILFSMIQHAGPFIRSIKLRSYNYHGGIIQFGKFFYLVVNFYSFEDVKNMAKELSQACKNISNVELKNTVLSLEELVHSNQNIKKLSLYNVKLDETIPSSRINDMDMIDEVRVLCTYEYISNFDWLFPKVKKLMFCIEAYFFGEADQVMDKVLSHSRELKSLTFVMLIRGYNEQKYTCKGLTNIADAVGLPLLEQLRVVAKNSSQELMSFEDGTVMKMISGCHNLRIIRLDHVDLGDASADAFLVLPKLEELYIDPVKKFSCLSLPPLNHLTRLTLKFDLAASLDFPSLCNAIKQMPALLNLEVLGLSEKQSTELTCTAVAKGMEENRDVVIDTRSSRSGFLKICKNGSSKPINFFMPEIKNLNLLIGEQSKMYCEDIIKFVDSLLMKCNISKFTEMPSSESNEKPESDHEDDIFINSVLTSELDSVSENRSYDGSHEMDSDEYADYEMGLHDEYDGWDEPEYYEDQWLDEDYYEGDFFL